VRCLTNEVRVPAHAEIVIEGRILPGVREAEGPFGEFPKYYSPRDAREVIEIDCVTHRAIRSITRSCPPSSSICCSARFRARRPSSRTSSAASATCSMCTSRRAACAATTSTCSFASAAKGQPKNVICAAFGAHYDIKHVVVVDDDVDVHDPQQVEWAIATRFQADRDLVWWAARRAPYSILPPTNGISAKLGFDATRPLHYEEHRFTRVRIPGEDTVDLERVLQPLAPSRSQDY
jgi:2,5-furandicarboxylate decarboxylase 1